MAGEFKHVSVGADLSQAEWESTSGHVLNSQATGDIIYASSATQLTRLGIGSSGQSLIVSGGIPAWGASSAVDLQTFTANGTWTKPSGASANSRTLVRVYGAGGGGGGGAGNATTTNSCGGGGGGGGAAVEYTFLTSSLSSTETVTIGSGGTAGTAGSAAGAAAGAGGSGGNTSFGSWLSAYGGGGGGAGYRNGGQVTTGGGGGGAASAGAVGSTLQTYQLVTPTAGGQPYTTGTGWVDNAGPTGYNGSFPGESGGGFSSYSGQNSASNVGQVWYGPTAASATLAAVRGGAAGACACRNDATGQPGGTSLWGGGGGGHGASNNSSNVVQPASAGGASGSYSNSGGGGGAAGGAAAAGTAGQSGATNLRGGYGGGGGGSGNAGATTGGAGGAGGARGGGGGGGGTGGASAAAGAGGAGGAGYCEVITYL